MKGKLITILLTLIGLFYQDNYSQNYTWEALYGSNNNQGLNGNVYAITTFQGKIVVAGGFTQAGGVAVRNVAMWDRAASTWTAMGTNLGTNPGDTVRALEVYNNVLYAGGSFSIGGGAINIARWSGTTWVALTAVSPDSEVKALKVFGANLIAGGEFDNIGKSIASWNGSAWSPLGQGLEGSGSTVNALTIFNANLIAGGRFENSGGTQLNYIAKWNGSAWSRMITGMDEKVEALFKTDSTMYAGGEFTIAGGKIAHHIAHWYNHPTDTIRGTVKYADNNANVDTGTVYSIRRDYFTNEVIVVDSGKISNGTYSIPRPSTTDTLRVIWFPDDELDFVPTYYPSTIDWRNAVTVVPGQNTNNINGLVYRVAPEPLTGGIAATVHGTIHLNIIIPLDPPGSYPYRSTSVLYVKQGNSYKRFAVSSTNESYITTPLVPGSYELIAYRLGYCLSVKNITINPNTTDTIVNFNLDTCSPIGIHNIGGKIPDKFALKQNYPNPFNPVTTISFDLPVNGFVQMKVYDVLGREVALLVNEYLKKGEYKYVFEAAELPSGVYFYTLSVIDLSASLSVKVTKKMVLIK